MALTLPNHTANGSDTYRTAVRVSLQPQNKHAELRRCQPIKVTPTRARSSDYPCVIEWPKTRFTRCRVDPELIGLAYLVQGWQDCG